MSTKFIIHAGGGKCGSTAIQTGLIYLQKYNSDLRLVLPSHRDIHELDVGFPSGQNATRLVEAIIGDQTAATTVISNEYLLSRPFAIASLLKELQLRSGNVKIIYYTRHPYDFAISAFRYFFRHTPSILEYIRSSPIYQDAGIKTAKPDLLFALIEMQNNFRFLAGGIPNHMLWKESYYKVRTACGLSEDEAKDTIKVIQIPSKSAGFDIIESFLKISKIELRRKPLDLKTSIYSNAGPDARLVNSLLHYQLSNKLSSRLRIHDHSRADHIDGSSLISTQINNIELRLRSLFAKKVERTQMSCYDQNSKTNLFKDLNYAVSQEFLRQDLIRQIRRCSQEFTSYYIPKRIVKKLAIDI